MAMPTVIDAVYLAEAREAGHWPPEGPVEVAIAGRSNVGKSTLLNRLAGRRALARVSKTPGRTRGLIFYDLSVRLPGTGERLALRLVDLPGYGYAQVSRDERKAWQRLVEGYVKARSSLRLFLILLDARRAPGEEEIQLVEWLRSERVPHHLVVTKTDKLRTAEHGAPATRRVQPSDPTHRRCRWFREKPARGWTRCGPCCSRVYATAGPGRCSLSRRRPKSPR